MTTWDPMDFRRDRLSPEEVEDLVRQARADRDAALGRLIGAVCRGVIGCFQPLRKAVEDAARLRALSMMNDQQLSSRGLDRTDLPAFVYGWKVGRPAPIVSFESIGDPKTPKGPQDRIAA